MNFLTDVAHTGVSILGKIFKTNLLPVAKEFVQANGDANPVESIITDFSPKINLAQDSRSMALFNLEWVLLTNLVPS